MNWRISFSDVALKFLRHNHLQGSFVVEKIISAI